eukprot:IDg6387t1
MTATFVLKDIFAAPCRQAPTLGGRFVHGCVPVPGMSQHTRSVCA